MAHVNHLKPEAGDPLHEPGKGSLIRQLGTKGGRARAHGELAVLEYRAQRSAGLAGESDLICCDPTGVTLAFCRFTCVLAACPAAGPASSPARG
jgi:hypothetical protein